MEEKRRTLLRAAALSPLGLIPGDLFASEAMAVINNPATLHMTPQFPHSAESLIGDYGPWASSFYNEKIPALSFRQPGRKAADLTKWQQEAHAKTLSLLGVPEVKPAAKPIVHKQYIYDGLQVEEISWQLAYGRPTSALVLKPAGATGKLPGILAFHDHGGNKYLGTRKITRTADQQHPAVAAHQLESYEGTAWANEIAKRGYVVLVPDAFPFASRRVMLADVPQNMRNGLTDENPEEPDHINAYNKWAAEHEHIMAKSLFSAGLTWPGVFWAEDSVALDILCARPDVNATAVGCGGLSGGGMRTVFMGGLDPRIKCAVCVGFMTTWKDFVLYKSFTHTWMTYVPILPQFLDFPEILGLRVPLPTMVLNDSNDDLYTLPEMEAANRILKEIYTKAGMQDRYQCNFYPGPHKFDKAMQQDAFNWFDKWLKK